MEEEHFIFYTECSIRNPAKIGPLMVHANMGI